MKNPTHKMNTKGKAAFNGTPRPMVDEAKPAVKSVKMAPKINQEVGGKRVLVNEAKPSMTKGKATFKAPRKEGGTSPAESGYTKVG